MTRLYVEIYEFLQLNLLLIGARGCVVWWGAKRKGKEERKEGGRKGVAFLARTEMTHTCV